MGIDSTTGTEYHMRNTSATGRAIKSGRNADLAGQGQVVPHSSHIGGDRSVAMVRRDLPYLREASLSSFPMNLRENELTGTAGCYE